MFTRLSVPVMHDLTVIFNEYYDEIMDYLSSLPRA